VVVGVMVRDVRQEQGISGRARLKRP
jgi:hypothetical protein